MKTLPVYAKDLKKGDLIISTGVTFEVIQDSFNRGQKSSPRSSFKVKNDDRDIWEAWVKPIINNEKYDPQGSYCLQSNSKHKYFEKIVS